ncbi:MAG: cupin domain-containing protein [Allosphingosinicella sp.]
MPRLELDAVTVRLGSDYPPPHDRPVAGRAARLLSETAGLTDFVVVHSVIPPGGWSSQRHWHEGEDEFVLVVSGRGLLVEQTGRTPLGPGDCAVFPKGAANGHHIVNDGEEPLLLVAISCPERSPCHYPDLGLVWRPDDGGYRSDQA